MRPNNFSENYRKSHQAPKIKPKQQTSKQVPKFILKINHKFSNKSNNSFTKPQTHPNKISPNFLPLISQKLERYSESSLQVLGITLMKIMAHQLFDNGYSSLKLNILKTIHDIEKQIIFHKYHLLFNFKTSPHELVTILNSSLKLIENSLKNSQLTQKYLHISKNSQEYESDCIKIHQIVINHMQKFQICLQFFTILVKMILMLVQYPKIDSTEIYLIVCDYLDCRIEQNSQCYVFQKGHFIKQSCYHFQFGLIINESIKSIKSTSKPLFFSAQNKSACKSVQKLFINELKSTTPQNRSIIRRNTEQSIQKGSSPKQNLKKSFLFLNLNQKDIQKCENVFEVSAEKSIYIEKENVEITSLNTSEGSYKLTSILNTSASVHVKSNKKPQTGKRKSFNFSEIKSREKSEFKCFRCSQKKELFFANNVVKIQVLYGESQQKQFYQI